MYWFAVFFSQLDLVLYARDRRRIPPFFSYFAFDLTLQLNARMKSNPLSGF